MRNKTQYIIKLSIILTSTIAVVLCAVFALKSINHYIIKADKEINIGTPTDRETNDIVHNTDNNSQTDSPISNKTFEPLINAYKVIINGNIVGIVNKNIDIDELVEDLKLKYESTENIENTIPEIIDDIKIVQTLTFEHNLSSMDKIMQEITDSVSFKINAYKLSVDNYVIGYFETEEECNTILDDAKNKFILQNYSSSNIESISYDRAFDICKKAILKEELNATSHNDAVDIIISDRTVDKHINVSSKDELDTIFSNKSVSDEYTYDDILKKLDSQGNVDVTYEERLVNFNIKTKTSTTTVIPYTTSYRTNSSLDHSSVKIINAGSNGSTTTVYSNTYVNCDLTSSTQISSSTINPVARVVEYGTLLSIRSNVTAKTCVGYFKMPLSGVYLNPFSQSHKAIDIAAPSGTPIYASATGVVTIAEDLGTASLGKYVVIEHNNGYSTCYGHMYSFIVSSGQTVQQGQLIGYVGRTGVATGNHCHFAIFATKSKTYINPLTMLYGY